MLSKIKKLLFNTSRGAHKRGVAEGGDISAEELDKKAKVAICALLIEMANFDGEFHEDEKKVIIDLVESKFGLTEEEANELIALSDESLKESIDIWQFTKLLNRQYDKNERIHLLEMLWKVVYADGRLDGHEDFLIHKFAKLLKLQHKDLIDAKINAKNAGS